MLNKYCSAFLLFYLGFSPTLNAQPIIEQLEHAYEQNAAHNKEHCILNIIRAEDLKDLQNQSIQQIILIRHGEPLLSKEGLFTSYMAQEYSRLYDEVEVRSFDKSPVCLDDIEIDTIFSSTLIRAVNTAEQIIGEKPIALQSEALFREFEREVLVFPIIRLPLNFWLVMSRLMWYAGLNTSNIESAKIARQRVDYAAKYLEYKSKANNPTILVAHGMFNKSLAKALQKRGWAMVYSNGLGYLNVRVLAKLNP